MKNILIQSCNNKFVNNLKTLKSDDFSILCEPINGNLYKIFYGWKFTHAIFMESLLSPEILQFTSEFFQDIKIFIYHDKQVNLQIIEDYHIAAKQLVESSDKKINNAILLPKLYNDQLFNNKNLIKNNDIVCFMDNFNSIPENLAKYLLPNSNNLPIKLFNNININHPQNLGLLSELDKSMILNMSKNYLSLDGEYVQEAKKCGCSVWRIDALGDLANSGPKQLRSLFHHHDNSTDDNYTTYSKLMEEIIL